MKVEALKQHHVKGHEEYYLKVTNDRNETHFINIGKKTYDKLTEMAKQIADENQLQIPLDETAKNLDNKGEILRSGDSGTNSTATNQGSDVQNSNETKNHLPTNKNKTK